MTRRRPEWTAAVAGVAAVLLVACDGGERAPVGATSTTTTVPAASRTFDPAKATFVGSAACAGCHQAETAAWRGSDHDLAMQVADQSTVLGAFDGRTLRHFGVTSTFFTRDGGFFVRTDGPDGRLAEYRVAYTFGVDPLQQYLVAMPDGRMQALPLAWDTRPRAAGGQRWFHLNPGEAVPAGDLLHWTGIANNWNHMCAECHSTDVRKHYDEAAGRYATTWSEIDVACEACHGPGSNHVAWANDGASASAGGKGLVVDLGGDGGAHWVMDPATGIARRSAPRRSHVEVETCGRCHSRRGIVSEDYVWGRPLMDTHRVAVLEPGLYHADGQIEGEVYEYGSFVQSRMFAAGVTCTDCHDAHSTRLRGVTGDPNAVCAQCHLPGKFATPEHHHHPVGSPGASCVACHMPERTYMVVDGRRDHGFRVPRPDRSVTIGTPNACNDCHLEETAQWAAAAAARWWGPPDPHRTPWADTIAAGRAGASSAGADLARLVDDPVQPAIVRATAVALLGPYLGPTTGPSLERALRDPDPMVRVAALVVAGDVEPGMRQRLAAPLLRDPVRTVRIEAARALAAVPAHQIAAADRQAFESALAEYRAAQLVSADRPEGQLNLGQLAAERGDLDEAERRFERALRLAPAMPSPYLNLADLRRAQGREAEGEQLLRTGLTRAPGDADLYHALGLALVRQRRLDDALGELARAAELAPDRARYAYVYAVALHDRGRSDEALRVLRAAHERRPGDRDVLIALATMSRDRGDRDAARAWARALSELDPQDPGAQRLVTELER